MRYLLVFVSLVVAACGKDEVPEPEIRQDCTMDRIGDGTCRFTNVGETPGAVCGQVVVKRHAPAMDAADVSSSRDRAAVIAAQRHIALTRSISGPLFCSGTVAPKETVSVSFSVVAVAGYCASRESFADTCSFSFERKDDARSGKDTAEPMPVCAKALRVLEKCALAQPEIAGLPLTMMQNIARRVVKDAQEAEAFCGHSDSRVYLCEP